MSGARLPTRRTVVGLLLACALIAARSACAQPGEQIAKAGTAGGAPACVTCHGPTGQGQAAAGFPRLAGSNAGYFTQQLQSFVDATRTNPIMGPIAKLLSASDRRALAAYYAGLPALDVDGGAAAPEAVLSAGKGIAHRGEWGKGLPACAQCHGAEGLGVGTTFPQIAGQSATYIANQLQAWRAGTRKNDPMGLMHGVALKLSASEVSAVAAYYASLPPSPNQKRREQGAGVAALPKAAAGSDHAVAVATAAPSVAPPASTSSSPAPAFTPPPDSAIPDNEFGQEVKLGQAIFNNTSPAASAFVGNSLRCASCHLDAGRLANSAPMWAAYVEYPAYRSKNGHVNTLAERIQGCFSYSMNGSAPPLGDRVLVALETYFYFLAKGAPVGASLPGHGYPTPPKPALAMDFDRGAKVFEQKCSVCHGADGQGQFANGAAVFPPLWGPHSFNWGAGMGSIKNAAGFIKANMPLSQGNTLTDQQAWDVAAFMDSHERPQDPRFKGSIADTRKKYHDSPNDMYGRTVNGKVLGKGTGPAKKAPGGPTQ